MLSAKVQLQDVPPPGDWAKRGACRNYDTAMFFPNKETDTGPAKEVCRTCLVLRACRLYALEHPAVCGIWGGLSDQDRRRYHKRQAEASRVLLTAKSTRAG